jgi:hypothetical protein
MCLDCVYMNFGKCHICREQRCYDVLYENDGVCDSCYSKPICKQCKMEFPSRNKLFRHLDETQHYSCKGDDIARCVKCPETMCFDKLMKQYGMCNRCFQEAPKSELTYFGNFKMPKMIIKNGRYII